MSNLINKYNISFLFKKLNYILDKINNMSEEA